LRLLVEEVETFAAIRDWPVGLGVKMDELVSEVSVDIVGFS